MGSPQVDIERNTQRQYLTFQLGDVEYAVAVLSAREIIEYRPITAVPMTPDWVLGVINLRGSVVPVCDLARRFGLLATTLTKRTCIVIAEVNSGDEVVELGMLVDSVKEVLFLGQGDVQPAPELASRGDAFALEGIANVDGRFILLVDCDKALDHEPIDSTVLDPSIAVGSPSEHELEPASGG